MIKPYYESELGQLYHGDCLEILPQLEEKVDLVLTDPPYGIDGARGQLNLSRAKGNYTSSFNDTSENIQNKIVPTIAVLINQVGCVVVTPGNKNFSLYPQPNSFGVFYQPAAVGLQVFGNIDAQPIFYYGKNASKKNMGVPCSYILTESSEPNGHPCPKPIKIWTKLLNNISLPSQTVLDPFLGSGTTAVACERLGRRWIGIEISKEYCDIAVKRIERERSQLKLCL